MVRRMAVRMIGIRGHRHHLGRPRRGCMEGRRIDRILGMIGGICLPLQELAEGERVCGL